MISVTPYFSFEKAKEALAYYQETFEAYNISRKPMTPEFAKLLKLEVKNFDATTVEGSFTVLGQKIVVSDEFGFPKQNSIIIAFDSSDFGIIKEYYDRIKIKEGIQIIYELQKDPFGARVFQLEEFQLEYKYNITWMFTEII